MEADALRYEVPAPAPRGPAPEGVCLERHPTVGELLVAAQDFKAGSLVLREGFLLLGQAELPPLSMFKPVPSEVGDVEIDGEGFPRATTFDNEHMKLLLAFVNAEREVQAEVLAMQDDMAPGCECAQTISRVARWLADRDLPWLEGLDFEVLFRLLRLFCVNSHPCRASGSTSGLLKWGTMINHSCRPNVVYSSVEVANGGFEGHFRACRDIRKGEVLGVTYMKSSIMALGSLVQRRRVLWYLKGFVCVCPRCAHEATYGDSARVLPCQKCKEPCELRWQYRPGLGSYAFVGTCCGAMAEPEAARLEAEVVAGVVGALFSKWRDFRVAEKETAKLREQAELVLHKDHFARWALRLLVLSLEGASIARTHAHAVNGAGGDPSSPLPEESERWLLQVFEAQRWIGRVRGEADFGGLLLMLAFGGLANPILDLLEGRKSSWEQEMQGWAKDLLAIDESWGGLKAEDDDN